MASNSGSRLKFVRAALIAGLIMVTLTGTAAATTPTLMWTGAKRVNILCNVAGGPGIDHLAVTKQLCRDVTRIAATGAPMPIGTIVIGDPAVMASDAVTLLIHASVTSHRGDRLLAFSVRPYRSSTQQADVLFGAIPRAAAFPVSGASPAIDAALTAALSETLPWLAKPQGPQRIGFRN